MGRRPSGGFAGQFILLALCYCAAGMNLYKVQPMLPSVMATLGIGEGLAGALISAGSVASIFLILPFGSLLNRWGFRKSGLLGLGLGLLGALTGCLSETFPVLLLSQTIASCGNAMFAVLGPSMIAQGVPARHRTMAMTLYTLAQTAAQFLMYNLIPRITAPGRIAPAWYLTTAVTAVLLAIWLVWMHPAEPEAEDGHRREGYFTALRQCPAAGQMAVGGFFYMLSAMCALSFLPAYLTAERGMDLAAGASLVSVADLVGIAFAFLGAYLADRLGTRKWVYFALVAVMAALRVLQVAVPDGLPLFLVVAMQGLPAGGTSLLLATVPVYARTPAERTASISLINTASMTGVFLSSLLFGNLVSAWGYAPAFLLIAPVTLLALIGMMTVKNIP